MVGNTIQRSCDLGAMPVGGEIDGFIFFTRASQDTTVHPPINVRLTAVDNSGNPMTFQNGAGFLDLRLPVSVVG